MAHEKYLQVLPEKFDGSGNFDDWVSNFDCISAINGWNEREMALWLRAHVTGKAHVAYKCFSHEIQENFTQIKAALRERFEPSSKQAYYRIEFERREKQDAEDWADFGDDLLSLANRAFPDLQEQAREQLALLRFFTQLPKLSPVCLAVKQRKPKCVREAVEITRELESYLHTSPLDFRHNDETENCSEQLIQLHSLLQKLQQVQERLADLEAATSSAKLGAVSEQSARKREITGYHPKVCHKCKQPGHYARGCAAKRQPRNMSAHQERTHQTLSVNSVTSYYLTGYVSNKLISFLVDTGAGVSLLNGRVWDKIKPSTVSVEPGVRQNLVGVDGHAIQVRGSVKIPVTISDRIFEQTFIIADGITAEGILGMDFLEDKCVFDVAKRQITFKQLEPLSLVPPAPAVTVTVSNVALEKTITIPASCEIEVMARLYSEGGPWLVEGKQRSDILVARAVVTPLRNSIPVRIVNTTTMPVTLYQGTNMATAELIEEVSISSVTETDDSRQVPHDTNKKEVSMEVPLPAGLTELQKEKFLALLSRYADVMAVNSDDLGCTNILTHRIETNEARQIRHQARRVPLPHRGKVQELLRDMLHKEVISPSTSP